MAWNLDADGKVLADDYQSIGPNIWGKRIVCDYATAYGTSSGKIAGRCAILKSDSSSDPYIKYVTCRMGGTNLYSFNKYSSMIAYFGISTSAVNPKTTDVTKNYFNTNFFQVNIADVVSWNDRQKMFIGPLPPQSAIFYVGASPGSTIYFSVGPTANNVYSSSPINSWYITPIDGLLGGTIEVSVPDAAKEYANNYYAPDATGGSMGEQRATMNQTFYVSNNGYWKTGYSFSHWTENGTVYYQEQAVTSTRHMAFYANWTPNTYTITFDKKSGTGGTDSTVATYDAYPPAITPPTRYGYNFAGYEDSNHVYYYNSAGASIKLWQVAGNATLNAVWIAKTYTVTLNANGGTAGTTAVSATYAQYLPSGQQAPSATGNVAGYSFQGFWQYADQTGTLYYNDSMAPAAVWNQDVFNPVIYAGWWQYFGVSQYGSVPGAQTESPVVYGHSATSSSYPVSNVINIVDRPGYSNDGIYGKPGTQYADIKYFNVSGTIGTYARGSTAFDYPATELFYCHYTPYTYQVTFNGGSLAGRATISPTSKTVTYDSAYGDLATATCTGYTFSNWSKQLSTNDPVTSATIVQTTNDHYLYAWWTANVTVVTLDSSPGSGGTQQINATYDSQMPSITPPTRFGYWFQGYFYNDVKYYNADGTSAHIWDIDQSTFTLSSVWEQANYNIDLDPGIPTSEVTVTGSTNLHVYYGIERTSLAGSYVFTPHGATEQTGLAPSAMRRVFCGYFKEDGTKVFDKHMNSVVGYIPSYFGSDMTLYAHWYDSPVMGLITDASTTPPTVKQTVATYTYSSSENKWKKIINAWVYVDGEWKESSHTFETD